MGSGSSSSEHGKGVRNRVEIWGVAENKQRNGEDGEMGGRRSRGKSLRPVWVKTPQKLTAVKTILSKFGKKKFSPP